MTQLDTTTCPSCGKSTTICRHSHLGSLAADAERETWFWSLVAPLGVLALTVPAAFDAAHAWHKLIGALVQADRLTWQEAHAKATEMITEAGR